MSNSTWKVSLRLLAFISVSINLHHIYSPTLSQQSSAACLLADARGIAIQKSYIYEGSQEGLLAVLASAPQQGEGAHQGDLLLPRQVQQEPLPPEFPPPYSEVIQPSRRSPPREEPPKAEQDPSDRKADSLSRHQLPKLTTPSKFKEGDLIGYFKSESGTIENQLARGSTPTLSQSSRSAATRPPSRPIRPRNRASRTSCSPSPGAIESTSPPRAGLAPTGSRPRSTRTSPLPN